MRVRVMKCNRFRPLAYVLSAMAAVCAADTVALAGRQSKPSVQQTTPTFKSGVELVQVDVYVTDEDDRPVSDLTAEDFEIFENGQRQAITTFTPVSIPFERARRLADDVEPDVQTNTHPPGRVYLFILGRMAADIALRARHLVRDFLTNHFGDNDVAAVITGRTYPGDRQDFTANRRLLLSAVDRFDGTRMDMLELAELMEMTARIPGSRKLVVWVGEEAVGGFRFIDYNGGVLETKELEAAHAAVAAATRGNIRFYLVDPRGLTTEFGGLEERMEYRATAEMTGGFAVTNSNMFIDAFDRIVRETSTYYLLAFESAGGKPDGRYVRLEVKVKRPGLKVRSRTGYLQPLPYRLRRQYVEPARTPIEAALANPLATPGVPLRVSAVPYKRSGRNANVALTVDLDPSDVVFTEKNGIFSAAFDVRHVAVDVDHRIYPEYRHRGTINLDATNYARVRAGGIRVLSGFEVPDGRYQVRVAAASGEQRGSVVYDLDVPDFRNGKLTMSGVSLATMSPMDMVTLLPGPMRRNGRRSTQCRSSSCEPDVKIETTLTGWQTGDRRLEALPHGMLPASPTTARSFTALETVALFVEIYDNNNRVPNDEPYQIMLTARLRDGTRERVKEVSEKRSSRAARRPSGGHGFTLLLPLAGAAPGAHVIDIEARFEHDPELMVSRSIPIRIE